jgi:hypothetical protein
MYECWKVSNPIHAGPEHVDALAHARDANIAGTFLHNDCKDNPFLDAGISRFADGVKDAPYMLAIIPGLEHLRLVDVKERDEVFPRVHAREGRRRAGDKRTCYHFLLLEEEEEVVALSERSFSGLKSKTFLPGNNIIEHAWELQKEVEYIKRLNI